jgi:predicted nucleic acid-binding Zn ribbon protein
MNDDVVRQLIRQRIHDGRLPRHRVIELGFGSGVGHQCDGCGTAIEMDQRMTVRICAEDWRTIRLHDDCFQIWDAERSLVERAAGA